MMFWRLVSSEEISFYKYEDCTLYRKLKSTASDTFRILYLDSKSITILSAFFKG